MRDVELAVGDEREIDEVQTHGAALRCAHATELRLVAGGVREHRIAEAFRGLSNRLHQRASLVLVTRGSSDPHGPTGRAAQPPATTAATMTRAATACAMCPRVMMSTSCDSVLPSLRRDVSQVTGRAPRKSRENAGTSPGFFPGIVANRCAARPWIRASVSAETFRFDIATGRLWSGDGEVRLTPKAAEVLKELVTHAGAPVSKESLFAGGLERRRRQRRCADLVRAGTAASAERRSQAAAVHRDAVPARLSDSWPR